MRVNVRLYATLSRFAPGQPIGESLSIEFADGTSLETLIRSLRIPSEDVHLTIVNGRIISNRATPLANGDRIALFPPVGGG